MPVIYSNHRLPHGPQLGHAQLTDSECSALSIYIPVGSRDETGDFPAGLAHFNEHMAFKGTKSRSAKELNLLIESGGGQMNACTSEDHTVYEVMGEADFLPTMINALSDMVWRSTFPEDEIKLEREVIQEEIIMVRESPTDHIGDLLASSLYPNHPLGQPISGSAESISKISQASLKKFSTTHYFRDDIVIATAGPMSAEQVIQALQPYLPPAFTPAPPRLEYRAAPVSEIRESRATDQLQLGLAWQTEGRHSEKRHALRLLSLILGESSSSRLFQKLREERGLCYQIGSEVSLFHETGALQIIAGLDHESEQEALELIYAEIEKLRTSGPSTGELERAKRLAIVQSKLAFESTASHAAWVGEGLLFFGNIPERKTAIARLQAVSVKDVQQIAEEIFTKKPAMALIQPES